MKKKWIIITASCVIVLSILLGVTLIGPKDNDSVDTKTTQVAKIKNKEKAKEKSKQEDKKDNATTSKDVKKEDTKGEKKEDKTKEEKQLEEKEEAATIVTSNNEKEAKKEAKKENQASKPSSQEANKETGSSEKTWVPPVYEEVFHAEKGHYEAKQTGTQSQKTGERWICACGQTFPSYDAWLAQKNENGG